MRRKVQSNRPVQYPAMGGCQQPLKLKVGIKVETDASDVRLVVKNLQHLTI
jgi:hypothetical protein